MTGGHWKGESLIPMTPAVTIFIDQGKVEAMKSPSHCEGACCDELQFRATFKVRTSVVFDSSLFDKRKTKNGASAIPHTFAVSCVPRGTDMSLVIVKALKEEGWALK